MFGYMQLCFDCLLLNDGIGGIYTPNLLHTITSNGRDANFIIMFHFSPYSLIFTSLLGPIFGEFRLCNYLIVLIHFN